MKRASEGTSDSRATKKLKINSNVDGDSFDFGKTVTLTFTSNGDYCCDSRPLDGMPELTWRPITTFSDIPGMPNS